MSQRFFFSLILLFFAVLFADNCYPQSSSSSSSSSSSDSITISTYYPSPYGVYKRLKLLPSEEKEHPSCDQSHEGDLFYDKEDKAVKVCQEDEINGWQWGTVASLSRNKKYNAEDFCITDEYGEELCLSDVQAFSDAQMLVNGAHTVGDCKKAGGEVVDSNVGLPQCRFNRSSCPSGWAQYKSYDTTVPHTCYPPEIRCNCQPVTTRSHAWTNSTFRVQCTRAHPPSTSHVEVSFYKDSNCCGSGIPCRWCRATITQIGCY